MDSIRRIVFSLAGAFLMVIPACAQKKQISEARDMIKSGSDVVKAEQLMTDLMKQDTAMRHHPKVLQTWFDAVEAQYQQANEKLYLKEAYDTVAFYNIIKRLFDIAYALDSVEAKPDAKGRVKPEYRKKHAQQLGQLRPNLYYGGTFHYRKGEYTTAFDYFDHYLGAYRQPLFTGGSDASADSQVPQAAYWATSCGYRLKDADRTLRYHEQALRDGKKAQFTLQYMCDAYQMQHNDSDYVATLREGFRRFPENRYFFPHLADYYNAKGLNEEVLAAANQGLQANEKNTIFLLAKSLALLNLERYDDCIAVSQQMIAVCDTLPEPYLNISTCYLNRALELEQFNEPRKYRTQLQKLYSDARPFMERYRELQPNDRQRWAPALYRIYLNLNMGKQFDEIDQLMR